MGVFDGLQGQVLDVAVRDQRRRDAPARARSLVAGVGARLGLGALPEVRFVEGLGAVRGRPGAVGRFAGGYGGLVIELDSSLLDDPGELRETVEHECAHWLTWVRHGDDSRGHGDRFEVALGEVRGTRVPPRGAKSSATVRRRASWGPSHRNWRHHGAVDCGFSCQRHRGGVEVRMSRGGMVLR